MLGIIRRFARGRRPAPRGMQGTEIMARYKDGKEIKDEWVPHLEEAYKFAIPHRNTFYDQNPGAKKHNFVFDSTAVLGVPSFATKLQAMLMPPWRQFSEYSLGPDLPVQVRDNKRLKELLAEQTDLLFSHFNHSNMATQVHESFQDLSVGTGCYDILSGTLGGKSLNFNAIPLPELTLEEGPQSTIETTYRDLAPRARNIERQWPGADLPTELQKLVNDKGGTKVPIVESVIFDPEMQRWEGAAVWKEEKKVFWRAAWRTNPRIVFRWSVTPGEMYGRGPILQVLADIKTANKVVEFILRNAALIVAGMWTATTDSALNPYNFRIVPGGVTTVQSNDRQNPTIKALERSGDLRLGFEVLTQLQETIRRALFQHLREPSDSVISATQFALEHRDLVDEAGSSFGRLQTETVEATITRATDVLSQRGSLANMTIDGRQMTLKHLSPLARAQDLEELISLQHAQEASGSPEVFAMGVKVEELGAWVAEKTGVDPRLIRSKAEAVQLKQDAANIIANTMQQAA